MKKIFILLFISGLGIFTGCEKADQAGLSSKKFRVYVVGREGTCYSWQIKFVGDRKELNLIMGKDSAIGGVYSPVNFPDSLKSKNLFFDVTIRKIQGNETFSPLCNMMGLPPKGVYLTSVSDVEGPI